VGLRAQFVIGQRRWIRRDLVRDKARRAGLPADTQADLEQALFSDGFSTAAQTTDTSGRGVGMAALPSRRWVAPWISRASPGKGTTLRFRFPGADGQILPLRPPTQPNFGMA
jgi:hypothetical protein